MFRLTLSSHKLFRSKKCVQFRTSCGKHTGNKDEKSEVSKSAADSSSSEYSTPIRSELGIRRALDVIANDFRNLGKGEQKRKTIPRHVDIAIVGGGVMGSSIAYWLKQRSPASFTLAVIERDQTYSLSSTTLSVGGIRQQFSLKENIEMSLFSAEFLRNIKKHLGILDHDLPDISFQHQGYLFLASEAGVENMKENHKLQKSLGAKVQLMMPTELKSRFPWINTDGIALASYGLENEGWFDPWALLMAFKKKAMSLGACYINGDVVGFKLKSHDHLPHEGEPLKTVNTVLVKSGDDIHEIAFAILVVCGGAHSGELARMLDIGKGPGIMKIPFPVEPRKRYVYVVHSENGPSIDLPFIIDHTGAYCRREGLGRHYIVGSSPPPSEEPDCRNLDVDYNFFEECVWPLLHHRIPAFEALKVKSAWAGYYDYNAFDQNAIIGKYPYYQNVFFATGFSGHGIQMAPSVGRAIMELIIDGGYVTTDLSRFSCDRIILNEPILEDGII